MDPIIDNDWLGFKNEPVDDQQQVGNVAQSWQCRETGVNPSHCPPNKTVLENIAEDILVQKPLNIRSCDLPGYPRSTFLMVFSPDGTKVASTHGNHNVYVSELASGKHVRILKGHPRTPWCIAFHPSHPQLIGSGCLGGQVRVWDLSGGSEVWTVENETVIASIAFHPRDQLLVIATYNELYFWDWSQPTPLTKVCTNNLNEKVRYVAFDSLGYKLITGISVWNGPGSLHHSLMQTVNQGSNANNSNQATSRRDSPSDSPGAANRNQDSNGSASQEMIVNSYQNLVQRYDSLVRNYQRLFMARHQLSNTTNTTDRGTDPMETDAAAATAGTSGWTPRPTRASSFRDFADDDNDAPPAATASVSGRTPRLSRITGFRDHADDEFDTPPPDYAAISGWTPLPTRASGFRGRAEQESSSRNDGPDSGDGEGSSSRLLNLDVLSINSDPSRSTDSNNGSSQERSVFGSRTSAFQRLNDHPERRSSDASERSTRLLPNPFSTTSNPISRSSRITFGSNAQQPTDNAGSSRTSVFTSHRLDSPSARYFMQRRRNALSPAQNHTTTSTNTSPPMRSSRNADGSNGDQLPSTSETPPLSPVAAQTINESLDLIRDILRDSGTRLLNLITNMSMTTLESVERSIPRRRHASLTRSDDGDAPARPRSQRPRARRIEVRRELLLTSESESDSDQSLEVNIFRTRNSSFQETATTAPEPSVETMHPTNRMVVELNVNDDDLDEDRLIPNDGFNISLERRFRVRSHSSSENAVRENGSGDGPSTSQTDYNRAFNEPLNLDPNRPSTSRDNYLMDDPLSLAADPNRPRIPPDEAFRKVRTGVNALHRHTGQLTDMWVHGSQTSMTDLRKMWENLRRRVLALHRQTSRQDAPSYYRSGLLERCRFLTEMSRGTRSTRNAAAARTRRAEQNQNQDSFSTDNAQTQMSTDSTSSSVPTENEPSTSAGASAANRTRQSRRATQSKWRNSPPTRRRLQSSYRWRPEDEMRRRLRNGASIHHSNMRNRRGHRDTRSFELLCTRNEIRMRAMQVLSIMFNMMMNCLEERGLSQLIIHMLKTLKKALALTCLMLMTNRMNRREPARNTESTTANENDLTTPEATAESTQSEMETQEGRTSATDNPEGHHDTNSTSSWPTSDSDDDQDKKNKKKKDPKKGDGKTDTRASSSQNMVTANPNTRPEPLPSTSQRWSNRLAVQISVANRNDSSTARNRRELYNEAKRLKALHRTNPNVHPISKRKVLPPVSTSRIPSLRRLPPKKKAPKSVKSTAQNTSDEPVAGPSNSQPGPSSDGNSSRDTPRSESMNEFEHRVNLFRIAHMHAVRLRNAARNRFRRLQTIRLYTPSSVREMFTLQSNNNDSPSGSQSPLNNASEMGRRPFTAYRPHILTTRNELGNREAGRQFDSILNNVAVPLVQVNDMPVTENQGPQPQRLPRVHEYLQPIILAQNALVVEDGGGGAGVGGGVMGGLLDAAFVSEALPAPTHRVQAWDFTTGVTPDIADATKNVVVQRCRIHNDASIDISKDGRLLVALLPVQRLRNTTHWLGVYSLEWDRLGQCLHTAVLEQSAVSVALSPTARHLAVGLGSRRFTTLPHARNNVFALLYRLSPRESSSRTGLSPIKELEQNWEQGFTSLNCLRWAPQPGQGLVYANNTGQLIIMS